MNLPLMPKATAVWLIENTSLTFDQIAVFCGMHPLEVKGIADGEVAQGIIGQDPIMSNQLTAEEIKRCEADPTARLKLAQTVSTYIDSKKKKKGAKYTPVARRQDKPDAIAWFLKHCPEVTEAQIVKLIGTTKSTINSVKSKSHWNMQNIRPRDPVLLGLCTQGELNKLLEKARLNNPQKNNNEEDRDDSLAS